MTSQKFVAATQKLLRRHALTVVGESTLSDEPRKEDSRTPMKRARQEIVDSIMGEDPLGMTAMDVVVRLEADHNITVSVRTVLDDLKAAGWTLKRRPRCPNMCTPERMAERLSFAKATLKLLDRGELDEKDIVFTDESFFSAGDFITSQWCKGDQEPVPLPKERAGY